MYFVPPFLSPLSFPGLKVDALDSRGWNVMGVKKHCSGNPGPCVQLSFVHESGHCSNATIGYLRLKRKTQELNKGS